MADSMHYLAIGLGIFFLAIGTLKVAPFEPGHGMQTSMMHRFSSVFPLRQFGFQPSAAMYCAMTGVLEIIFGILLAFGRYDYPVMSGFGLLVLMLIKIQSRLSLGDAPADFVVPVTVTVLLLILLFHREGLWGRRGHYKVHLH